LFIETNIDKYFKKHLQNAKKSDKMKKCKKITNIIIIKNERVF